MPRLGLGKNDIAMTRVLAPAMMLAGGVILAIGVGTFYLVMAFFTAASAPEWVMDLGRAMPFMVCFFCPLGLILFGFGFFMLKQSQRNRARGPGANGVPPETGGTS